MTLEKKILLVEDDHILARQIVPLFEDMNIRVEHVADGGLGLQRGLSGEHVLAILDVVLPGMNGFDICRTLRSANPLLQIIMLTTRGSEMDRILGLELGADDYVVKPFSAAELLARVRSKLRLMDAVRVTPGTSLEPKLDDGPIQMFDLVVDPVRRTVTKAGEQIDLTKKEFDLLLLLMRSPGRVFTKRELLHEIWQLDFDGYEDSVVSMVRRLRSKIEDDRSKSRYIKTVHGLGYAFAQSESEAQDEAEPD